MRLRRPRPTAAPIGVLLPYELGGYTATVEPNGGAIRCHEHGTLLGTTTDGPDRLTAALRDHADRWH